MKCLETRTTPEGFKRRRYRTASNVIQRTIEVPLELWDRVNSVGRQRDRAAEVMRTIDKQSKKRQAIALRKNGVERSEVAKAVGVSVRTVSRWTNA